MLIISNEPRQKIAHFHGAIVPMQSIPSLGEYVAAACSENHGASLFHSEALLKRDTVMFMPNAKQPWYSANQPIVLFGATFHRHRVTFADGDLCIPRGGVGDFGFVTGHQLLAPVPALDHPAFIPLRYVRFHPTPHFVTAHDAEPIMQADIVVIKTRKQSAQDDRRKCDAFAIIDASKL